MPPIRKFSGFALNVNACCTVSWSATVSELGGERFIVEVPASFTTDRLMFDCGASMVLLVPKSLTWTDRDSPFDEFTKLHNKRCDCNERRI